MTQADVLCIGDLDVDMFIDVPAVPGPDQKVTGRNHGLRPGGMAANAAVAIARFGLKSRLVAAIGDDSEGAFALREIERDAVDLRYLIHLPDTATFMCLVLLSPSGEKSLIRLGTPAYLPDAAQLDEQAFLEVRHLHLTYGSPVLSHHALRLARRHGLSTSLDLEAADVTGDAGALRSVLALVDTLFLNEAAHAAAAQVMGVLDVSQLREGGEMIVTSGGDGCRRITAGGTMRRPAFSMEPVDTTGAGDCFSGSYIACRLADMSAPDSLEYASAAAALATLDRGAQAAMPRRAEVDRFLNRHRRGSATNPGADVDGEQHV
ncbi:carbohydrate kinase family protein [Salipiger sp.]|uniref:carbohydrate kinase family protein n=1 Tax=Salipiger sp. TaxID=2078585 RepID=UPI003A979EC6